MYYKYFLYHSISAIKLNNRTNFFIDMIFSSFFHPRGIYAWGQVQNNCSI